MDAGDRDASPIALWKDSLISSGSKESRESILERFIS